MLMALFMKENGEMINKKDLEEKNGLTKACLKDNIKMERSMEWVSSFGQMVLAMKVNGWAIKCTEKAFSGG